MREIEFRGKTKEGSWIHGSLLLSQQYSDGHRDCFIKGPSIQILDGISTPNHSFHEVDPNTVGQYTCLTDKNGVKIFEGDIVCGWQYDKNKKFIVEYKPSDYVCGFICKELDVDNSGCILPGYQGIEVI